jgi:hypothetical protein
MTANELSIGSEETDVKLLRLYKDETARHVSVEGQIAGCPLYMLHPIATKNILLSCDSSSFLFVFICAAPYSGHRSILSRATGALKTLQWNENEQLPNNRFRFDSSSTAMSRGIYDVNQSKAALALWQSARQAEGLIRSNWGEA